MKDITGVCQYCGQLVTTDLDFASQQEADIWATENCSCDDAEIARQKRESALQAERQVEVLYGPGCEEYGFKPLDVNSLAMLKNFVRTIAYGDTKKISAVLSGRAGTFTATVTSKGKIKVSRAVGNTQTLEA